MMERSIPKLLLPIICSTLLVAQETSQDSVNAEPLPPIFWTSTQFSANDIRRFPGRSLETLLQLVPGIGSVNGGLYGRGSRNGQIEYRVNGISVLDRYSNTNGFPFIPEAMEEVIVHTGAYGASLGANAGGSVEMKIREGGDTWKVTAQHLTDDFAGTGKRFLDTYSYGQHTSVFTLSGPLPYYTRLFVAAEVHNQRDRDPMYLEPFEHSLVEYRFGYYQDGMPLPEVFRFVGNHVPSTSENRNIIQWNLTSIFFGPQLRLWGSTSDGRRRDATWGSVVQDYFRQKRIPWRMDRSTSLGGAIEHKFSDWFSLKGGILYTKSREYTSDPDFAENWWVYPESLANAQAGYSGFLTRYYSPPAYSVFFNFGLNHPNLPNNSFEKRSSTTWRSNIAITVRPLDYWTANIEWEAEISSLRRFRIAYISGLRNKVDWISDGVSVPFQPGLAGQLEVLSSGGTYAYGYDGWGRETNDGPFGARHPRTSALSLENSIRDGSFVLQFGVRGVWFVEDIPTVQFSTNLADPNISFDYDLNVIPTSSLIPSPPRSFILPRVSLSHSGEKSRIFVALGSFVDALPYEITHIDYRSFSGLLSPLYRVSFNQGGTAVTYQVLPERTGMFEAGGEWSPIDGVVLSASMFKKYMPNQIEMGQLDVDKGDRQPIGFVNRGEGNTVGGYVGVKMTWPNGIQLQLCYAYLDARGHTSSPRGNQAEVTASPYFSPDMGYPLDFQQKHRVLAQLQFAGSAESPLEGFSTALWAKVNSGHPYTRMEGPEGIGSHNTMRIGVDYLSPIFSRTPLEPQNVSLTPWTATLDLTADYKIDAGIASVKLLLSVLNIFNTKNAENLYATTGSSSSDGWFANPVATDFLTFPIYRSLYRDLNFRNRWAYMNLSGNDLFSSPRQLRFGVEVEL